MADVNKPKLQLRSGAAVNGDKTPSPATKLLINHGKPNFTIPRSPKMQNGNDNAISPPLNDEFVVKSTKFNGVFKPSNISVATKQTLQQQQNGGGDNEASKVVLRRAKAVETELKEDEDENVPEFIRRQRRIQERLANQNISDFENRRSGYFTHVMISPTNPNRQSFVATMSSPAVMPAMEIPPPAQPKIIEEHQQQAELTEEYKDEYVEEQEHVVQEIGHDDEEVAKAIEEVNKAVEGEDDDKTEVEETPVVAAAVTSALEVDEKEPLQNDHVEAVVTSVALIEEHVAEPQTNGHVEAVVTPAAQIEDHMAEPQRNGHVEVVVTPPDEIEEHVSEPEPNGHVVAVVTPAAQIEEHVSEPKTNAHVEAIVTVEAQIEEHVAEPKINAHVEAALTEEHVAEPKTNGVVEKTLQNGQVSDSEITISHTNGLNGPRIPSPDPSGEKGVNFEPKTVVSFSQEMGSEINKYPDTVKVTKDTVTSVVDEELKELTKLKFEINTDAEDIEVKPVLITEKA